jgi:GntR family transcriptional regulator
MIKRSPSLTDQVKAHIKQQILDNAYEDDRIPAEMDLAEELGVSRTTVRDALSRLENEGVIFRKQGAGTFVNRPGLQIKSRLEEIWSYEAVLEDHGYEPSTRILNVTVRQADPNAQQHSREADKRTLFQRGSCRARV